MGVTLLREIPKLWMQQEARSRTRNHVFLHWPSGDQGLGFMRLGLFWSTSHIRVRKLLHYLGFRVDGVGLGVWDSKALML